jgi:hypothetical protein
VLPFVYGAGDQLTIPDARPGHYYVTARNGKRLAWLLGPYADHAEAIGNVEQGGALLAERDQWAWAYELGTARVDPSVMSPPKAAFLAA